jgi:formamidopyrimidine-DNA glycosylase
MPELPEVEVIRRDLVPKVVGRAIEGARLTAPRLTRRRGTPRAVEAALAGRTVRALRRRGKFLLFDLTGEESLVIRLGMTGQLRWAENGAGFRPDAHTHARLVFAGAGALYYRDVRKFGEMFLLPTGSVDRMLRIGREPLDPALRAEDLHRLSRATTRIKSLLLDQTKLAGVGNIYADEALFRAGIRPTRRAGTLTRAEAARLLRALRAVLRAGIRHRGSSISDYRDAAGSPGRFARLHRVYHRHGKPCTACGTPIRQIQVSQRSTHFCPTCQR